MVNAHMSEPIFHLKIIILYTIYTDTTHIRFFYASMSINLSAYCVMKMENCVFDKQIAEYSNCVFNRFLLNSAKQHSEQWIYRQKQFNFIDQTFIILFSIVMTNTHVSIYECNDFIIRIQFYGFL